MEIWGGIECTINRVKDKFYDQLKFSGHYQREQDIGQIASLGIKKIRYPILWEKHQSELNGEIDWNWTEQQLEQLSKQGIEPIAGLLHHGSGPLFTNMLDEKFPELFAAYAKKVATKFPWINYYTPVNEPLTTARFSGLYGHWYPHKSNDVSFVKMLLNQLQGTILAMQEIRKINPGAKFLQTEDLAKTYSTPLLSYQADFENTRRWLTYDILLGKLDSQHPLWGYFLRLGIKPERLQFFVDNSMTPDILGVNYYVTSERYLDENVENYPVNTRGGNTLHQYADVERVRVSVPGSCGLKVLLQEMWERYKLPMIISEIHLHCFREDQLRWFKECYETAMECKQEGMDLRACTAWALLGSYGWNKLLTGHPFIYETGVFDVSSDMLRPTALAGYIHSINTKKEPYHTILLNHDGWWKRDDRFFEDVLNDTIIPSELNPILIIGKTGTLGKALYKACRQRHFNVVLAGRDIVDICYSEQIDSMIEKYKPWAIINAAGYVRVDDAEHDLDNCYRANTLGPQKLAIACERTGIKLVNFSSDLVFDGNSKKPYIETDLPNPVNVYGKSKSLAEDFLTRVNPNALIIRTSAFFGPDDDYNFLTQMFRTIEKGEKVFASAECFVSPTYVPDLVHTALDLLIDNEKGIWHLANAGEISWYAFAKKALHMAGISDENLINTPVSMQCAKKPLYSVLKTSRGAVLPTLENAMERYISAMQTKSLNELLTA